MSFAIQIETDGGWNHLTTVPFPEVENDPDGKQARRSAYAQAVRQLQGWRGYDGFNGRNLRIVEQTPDGYTEAKP